MGKLQRIEDPDENNICSPCWLASGMDVKAVAVLTETNDLYTHVERTNLCGNHAELVSTDVEHDRRED